MSRAWLVLGLVLCACDAGTVSGGEDLSLDGGTADLPGSDGPRDVSVMDHDLVPQPDGTSPDGPAVCQAIPGVSYGKLGVTQPCGCNPAQHGDMNLLLRKWRSVAATKGLVSVTGPTDDKAPQLYTLFVDERVPGFPEVYQVEQWDWGCNCPSGYITSPQVTLAGMATAPGEVIRTPASGYDIGGGNTAVVLHAAQGTITLKYTTEDNVVYGYTIHLSGICVEPKLQALYDQCHAAGRKQLPALKGRQPLGRATGAQIQAAIRDTGSWMDPRVKKDWWQGK